MNKSGLGNEIKIGIIIAIMLFILLALWFNFLDPLYVNHVAKEDCQNFILSKIISPSTAVFSNVDVANYIGKDRVINFDIDTQNRMGGIIRAEGYCMFDPSKGIFDSHIYDHGGNILK